MVVAQLDENPLYIFEIVQLCLGAAGGTGRLGGELFQGL